jgi:hypothetical protein
MLKHVSAGLALAVSIWGCSGAGVSPGPTAPSTAPAAAATLSGVVFASTPTGVTPVGDVRIEVQQGTLRLSATTDQRGEYSVSGLVAGSVSVSARRDGYETVTRTVTLAGDTRLDLQVVRRATYALSGTVSEMTPGGLQAIAGVLVEDYDQHLAAVTDKDGFYLISGLYAGGRYVGFNRDGYQFQSNSLTISDNTRYDIQLVRR